MVVKVFQGTGPGAAEQVEKQIGAWLQKENQDIKRSWAIQHMTSAAASVGEGNARVPYLAVTVVFQRA